MGILATMDRAIRAHSSGGNPNAIHDFWFDDVGVESDSGIRVTPKSALQISTVFKCIRARAETFGTVPKKLKERVEILGRSGQRDARQHPLFFLLNTAPNPLTTSMAYFEALSADMDQWGHHRAWIQRNPRSGKPVALWRLQPDKVSVEVAENSRGQKQVWYVVSDANGKQARFYPDEIFNVPGLGSDGINGYSPVRLLMNTLGWNRATERYGAQYFREASRPSGIVNTEHPIKDQRVKDEIIASLRASGKKAGSLVLIEGGLQFHKLAMDQDEAQFIQTMEYQQEDICGIFRVPPHKIGILRRATNNNIEHQDIEWVRDSIQPICERVEQWFDLQMLSDQPSTGVGGGTERERFFMECELKGLLRGDTAAQTAHLEKMRDKGIYSANDCRDYLGLPPYENGDVYFINAAYIPVESAEKLAEQRNSAPAVAPAPAREDASAVVQQRLMRSYRHVFRNAAIRVMKRSKRDAGAIFRPILEGLAEGLSMAVDEDFLTAYLSSMEKRSASWQDVEVVSAEELDRAVAMILENGRILEAQ